ncbi:MAG: hypothetical protein ACOY5R_10610 [Pseudomonadota bacterium]|jgi:Xaa-Pro aminopeptidase
MSEGTFAIRPAAPSAEVVRLARTMFEAVQQAQLLRAGHGMWFSWDALPQLCSGQRELWIAAAEAALAHLASDPASVQIIGGIHG